MSNDCFACGWMVTGSSPTDVDQYKQSVQAFCAVKLMSHLERERIRKSLVLDFPIALKGSNSFISVNLSVLLCESVSLIA